MRKSDLVQIRTQLAVQNMSRRESKLRRKDLLWLRAEVIRESAAFFLDVLQPNVWHGFAFIVRRSDAVYGHHLFQRNGAHEVHFLKSCAIPCISFPATASN